MRYIKGAALAIGLSMITLAGILCLRVWTWEREGFIHNGLSELSETLGSVGKWEKVNCVLFPVPEILLEGCDFSVEKVIYIRVKVIKIRPSFLALAAGRVTIEGMEFVGLELRAKQWKEIKGVLDRVVPRMQKGLRDLHLTDASVIVEQACLAQGVEIRGLNFHYKSSILGMRAGIGMDIQLLGGESLAKDIRVELGSYFGSLPLKIKKFSVSYPELELQGQINQTPDPKVLRLELSSAFVNVPSAMRFVQMVCRGQGRTWAERAFKSGKVHDTRFHLLLEFGDGVPELKGPRFWGKVSGLQVELPWPLGQLQDLQGELYFRDGVLELSHLRATGVAGNLIDGDARLKVLEPEFSGGVVGTIRLDLERAYHFLSPAFSSVALGNLLEGLFRVTGQGTLSVSLKSEGGYLTSRGTLKGLKMSARHRRIPYSVETEAEEVQLAGDVVALRGVTIGVGTSVVEISRGEVELSSGWMDLHVRRAMIDLDETWAFLKGSWALGSTLEGLDYVTGRLEIEECDLAGHWDHPGDWEIKAKARIDAKVSVLPLGELEVRADGIELNEDRLLLKESAWSGYIGSFSLKGELEGFRQGRIKAKGELKGHFEERGIALLCPILERQTGLNLRKPSLLKIDVLALEGIPELFGLNFKAKWEALDLEGGCQVERGSLTSMKVIVKGERTQGTFSMDKGPEAMNLGWKGSILAGSLSSLLESFPIVSGLLEGDLGANLDLRGPTHFKVVGEIKGRELALVDIPSFGGVFVEKAGLKASKDLVEMEAEVMWGGGEKALAKLELIPLTETLKARGTLEADSLKYRELQEVVSLVSMLGDRVQGTLGIRVGSLEYMDKSIAPFHADVPLRKGDTTISLRTSALCGVGIGGKIDLEGSGRMDVHLEARDMDAERLLTCLGLGSTGLRGSVDLSGQLSFRGLDPPDLGSLTGSLKIKLSNASISGARLFKILSKGPKREELESAIQDFQWEKEFSGEVAVEGEFHEGLFWVKGLGFEMDGLQGQALGGCSLEDYNCKGHLVIRGGGRLLAFRVTGALEDPLWEVIPLKEAPSLLMERLEGKSQKGDGPASQGRDKNPKR